MTDTRTLSAKQLEETRFANEHRSPGNEKLEIAWLLGHVSALSEQVERLRAKAEAYDRINTPELFDFLDATRNEALHQRERWGVDNDGGKTDADWFWLIGYLAGKALHNPPKNDMGDTEARLHRIITVAAAAMNWHAKEMGVYARMRPGIESPDALATTPRTE